MIRRKIKTSELKFKFIELGTKSKTKIAVSYIESVALAPIVNEVFTRLQNINMDGVIDSNYIEELISDEPNFFMKTVVSSQRPDVISSKLLEGRIAILCDGTPEILTVPYLFIENLQSPEDYYNNYIYMSFNRLLRWASFFLTTSVPAIYVALVNFHQELIPTQLIVSLSAARQNVPLPTVVEAFSMMLFYEILREAGARSPKQIGEALSIVGALVLGDAAVNAKFISAPIVIITGVTGITGLAVPKVLSLVIVRIIFLALAACLGLYGYIFGVIALTLYLMSIRSFGVTYMERVGVGPINLQYLKDTAIRMPIAKMKTRPNSISNNIFRNRTQKNKKE
jgi:spore germination protein KA